MGRWVKEQRTNHRLTTLPDDRIQALEERDFAWVVRDPDETWTRHIELLIEYAAEYGDTLVPPNHTTVDGTRLGNWVRYVRGRRRKGSLALERISELDAVGFVWQAGPRGQKSGNQRKSDAHFTRVLNELRVEAHRHGTANLTYGYTTDAGTRLGEWLARNRRACREGSVHPDRAAALTALGVTLRMQTIKQTNSRDARSLTG